MDSAGSAQLAGEVQTFMFTDIEHSTRLAHQLRGEYPNLLEQQRRLIRDAIDAFDGREIDVAGDGFFITFSKATDAVGAAARIQKGLNTEQWAVKHDLKVRMGIHTGEFHMTTTGPTGIQVHRASRICDAAHGGQVLLSEDTVEELPESLDQSLSVTFLGAHVFKDFVYPSDLYQLNIKGLRHKFPPPRVKGADKRIAVLPFENASGKAEYDYVCSGLAEELINALGKMKGLRVASRSSSFALDTREIDVAEIGNKLNADIVLFGRASILNSDIELAMELVEAASGLNVWSDKITASRDEIFSVQDAITRNVSKALGFESVPLSVSERQTKDVEAYDYYLRGRRFYLQFSSRGMEHALQMFEKAIDADESYALAYAGIADAYSFLYQHLSRSDDFLERAENASEKAIELAPFLGEAYVSRGIVLSLQNNLELAEQAFENAIQCDPTSFLGWYHYARTCFVFGKIDKAARLFEQANRVEPEDYQSVLLAAQCYESLESHTLAQTMRQRGVEIARKWLEINPADTRALYLTANALVFLDERAQSIALLRRALTIEPDDSMALYNAACIYARLGMETEALNCLERSYTEGLTLKGWYENDPDLNSLRSHPRYKALIAKMG